MLYNLEAVRLAHFMSSHTCVCGDTCGHDNFWTMCLNTLLGSISTRSRRNRRLKIQEKCRNMRKLRALMCRSLRELRVGIEPSGANLAPAPAPAMRKFVGISRAGVQHFRVPKFWPDMLTSYHPRTGTYLPLTYASRALMLVSRSSHRTPDLTIPLRL